MRVLMTADCVGGVWTYALELCRALEPAGVEVMLATLGAPLAPDQRAEARALSNVTVHEGGFRCEWMEDPWEDVARGSAWLLELEARVRPDVIHLNDYARGALPWDAPVVVVAHSCVASWWEACRHSPLPPEWDRYLQAVGAGLRGADRVVAPSQTMLDAVARHHVRPRDGRVIPNGRDAAAHPPGRKEPFVLSAGRLWDEAKNIAAVESIAARLAWPVRVAGDPGKVPTRPPPGVERLGRLPSQVLAGWLSRAALYALPARYEPFGLSILEAAQAGCALVLGDIPSLRERWDGAAAFVDPEDPAMLASTLKRLIDDPAGRAALSDRARAQAAPFTLEAMAQGYLSLYAELAARPARPRRGEEPG